MVLFNFRDIYATKFGLPLSARYKHDKEVVENFVKEVLHQHPELREEYERLGELSEAWGRGLARLDYNEFKRLKARTLISITKKHNWRVWVEVGVIAALLLAVIVLSAKMAHGQVDGVKIQKDGATVGGPCMGGICGVNFSGSGCTVTKLAQVWTVTCTSGAVTNNPGGSANQLQTNNGAGAFGAIPSVGLGKVLIDQGAGNAPAFADPLVQGLTAHDAVGTSTNPVAGGGYASAAAPSDVSADGDIVRAWHLRSGAYVMQLSHSGSLIDPRQIRALTSADAITAVSGTAANFKAEVVFPSAQAITCSTCALETGGNLASIKAKTDNIPALGQALAAASVPVVLTALQLAALTPPAAITGFALETGGNLANTKTNTDALGAKTDAKSTSTDATSTSIVALLKEISAMVQAPASTPVTGTFFQSKQPVSAASGDFADGAIATLGTKADAKSTATDATAVTIMQVLKEISAMLQAPATTPASQNGTWTVQPGNTANTTAWKVDGSAVTQPVSIAANVGTTDAATSATAAAVPAKAAYMGGAGSGSTGGNEVGVPVGDTYKNINVSTATTTLLVTGVSGRQVRIAALHMITAAANNVAFIEGTGATCGTGSAGMAGGTTAASGYNLAANGGIAFGSGLGTVMQTATTGDSVCVVTSAATQLSGGLQYAIY